MGVIVNKDGALKNTTESSFYETMGSTPFSYSSNENVTIALDWAPKFVIMVTGGTTSTSGACAIMGEKYPTCTFPMSKSGGVNGLPWLTTATLNGAKISFTAGSQVGFGVCHYFK